MTDLTRTRLLALVGANEEERFGASAGGDRLEDAKRLPPADVLLLVAGADPDAMLFRYTAFGELGGDSWHLSVDDARAQADDEYGDALLPWEPVPDEVTDAHAYAIKFAADRLNTRDER